MDLLVFLEIKDPLDQRDLLGQKESKDHKVSKENREMMVDKD